MNFSSEMPNPTCLPSSLCHAGRPGQGLWRLLLAWSLLLVSVAGWSQELDPARRHYQISAGPLEDALNRFARQAGITLSYASEMVQGRQAPALQGDLAVPEGLARLLAGSGLRAVRAAHGSYAVQWEQPAWSQGAAVPQQAQPLKLITIVGGRDPLVAGEDESGYAASSSQTATRTATPLLEIPQSLSVVGRAEMEARGADSILDVLRYLPGANTETHGVDPRGYDYFNLRGFINAQNTSNYLNGLRQMVSGFGMFRTEAYGLERVEVLRGAASASFGQADPGGVVNRISKLAGADAPDEILASLGNFQRRQLAADLSGHADEGRLQGRIVGLALDSHTQFSYGNGRAVENDRLYLAPSLKLQLAPQTSLILLADYLQDRNGSSRWTAVRPDGSLTHTLVGDPGIDQQHGEQWSLGWQLEHRLDDHWRLQQDFRQAGLRSQYSVLNPGSLNGSLLARSSARYDTQLESSQLDTRLQGQWRQGALDHTLLLGLDLTRLRQREQRYRGDAPSLDLAQPVYGLPIAMASQLVAQLAEDMQQSGLYLQDQIRQGPLVWTLGSRYDRVIDTNRNTLAQTRQDTRAHAWSHRLGVAWKVTPTLAPYLNYSTAFLPQPGQDANGQPFAPSHARQLEAGLKFQPQQGRAIYTAALFQITKDHVLSNDPGHANFYVDQSQVRSRGLELEARGELWPGLNLLAAYSYTQALNIAQADPNLRGKSPVLVPRQAASLWLDYTPGDAWPGLGLGGGARYSGASYANADNSVRNAATVLLDAMLRLDQGRWRYSLNLSNLANRRHTSCLAEPTLTCFWAEERMAVLSARYRW
ncbi:TonB-dependent siderophore receptor [uncultured Herbaspirillum sp.]|uniref:TonB-dependent siderophore receptor n=1 Tax=uncultured Herbaspirillum sp. TaxID=160236 RepID=UPI00258629C6|nr:TonB-dependent siderophore receptor [uncultured Herbaspirillum sp.]